MMSMMVKMVTVMVIMIFFGSLAIKVLFILLSQLFTNQLHNCYGSQAIRCVSINCSKVVLPLSRALYGRFSEMILQYQCNESQVTVSQQSVYHDIMAKPFANTERL